MERAKKMVLIPMDSMDRFQRRITNGVAAAIAPSSSETTSTTRGDPISRLETELNDILKSPTEDNAEKWKLYEQLLQRYLYFSNESRKPVHLEIHEQGATSDNKTTLTSGATANTDEAVASPNDNRKKETARIVGGVPNKSTTKAKLFMGLLNEMPTRFTRNNAGSITIDGVSVPGTNIVDLVNHAMRSRKTVGTPAGGGQFARFLHAINVPKEYVGNDAFWRDIRAFDDDKLADAASTAIVRSTAVASNNTAIQADHARLQRKRSHGDSYAADVSGATAEEGDTSLDTPRSSRGVKSARKKAKGEPTTWRRLRLRE